MAELAAEMPGLLAGAPDPDEVGGPVYAELRAEVRRHRLGEVSGRQS